MPGDLFQQRPGQRVVAVARPVGERRDQRGELAVAVGLAELALRPGDACPPGARRRGSAASHAENRD